MTDWLAGLRDRAGAAPLAMISVLACEGSAPRGPGTRMLVTASDQFGTIGGGHLEFRAIEQARSALALPPGTWRVQDYPLGPLLGQCCGGRVRLLIEHVDPAALGWLDAADDQAVLMTRLTATGIERTLAPAASPATVPARGALPGAGTVLVEALGRYRRPLYLFGAGHVGQAIARHAATLPLQLAWFDPRPEFAEVGSVTMVAAEDLPNCVADAPADAALVILTHDHALDYALVLAALQREAVAFVGLIGSATKRARFLSRLARDGIDQGAAARLHCPIGLPGIRGKEPDVIAIATLAQVLGLEP